MKKYQRFWMAAAIGALLAGAVWGGDPAWAQEKFPVKPLNLIISWAAGGAQDLTARGIQPVLQKALGQSIIITNKAGGGASIGFNEIANAAPDGYTFGQLSPSVSILKYTMKADIDYVKFEPIMFGGYSPVSILVRKDAPWKTLNEFLAHAKANPGKLRVGNSGYAAIYHISAISMEHAAGVKFIHVPYKGGAPAIPALLGGHLDAASLSLTDAYHLVKAGKLRAIGVTSPVRSKFVPDAQTFKELGLNVDDITYFSWAAPRGVAKERIRILHDAIKKGVESKEFRDYCDSQAVTIAPMGPEEFAKFLVKEDKKWKETIMIGGIKPE